MPFTETPLKDLWLFEPRIFEDDRGYFYESFNQNEFTKATGITSPFIQDNHSFSKKGVLRGLHFQKPPHAQAKLIKVIQGTIWDVVVDLRKDSPTFSQHLGFELSAGNKKQLYVPQGFAHGFIVLSDSAEVLYKCDNFYAPQAESGIIYNDSDLAIDWKIDSSNIIISEKDAVLATFQPSNIPF
ncbi:dTDP-4-dehydrorhamnose 3,5-epimerase [Microscilla marina]|uniref:dTDP-4-dehydrorhamnose 3,5-epimerase n=1 Tax=Microscilla marina ATCC 23134 TaxID=313606 RepID=A1ZIA6_MICM2|nr:dTDP-4-dehydrorhamnose 3,5-epimerase [Microscilla marina]EAY29774.1 dTDP-4-dehydrorhamnose 3,5-epimerase [Microscilla marina ATCC 23134]